MGAEWRVPRGQCYVHSIGDGGDGQQADLAGNRAGTHPSKHSATASCDLSRWRREQARSYRRAPGTLVRQGSLRPVGGLVRYPEGSEGLRPLLTNRLPSSPSTSLPPSKATVCLFLVCLRKLNGCSVFAPSSWDSDVLTNADGRSLFVVTQNTLCWVLHGQGENAPPLPFPLP